MTTEELIEYMANARVALERLGYRPHEVSDVVAIWIHNQIGATIRRVDDRYVNSIRLEDQDCWMDFDVCGNGTTRPTVNLGMTMDTSVFVPYHEFTNEQIAAATQLQEAAFALLA